jgi:hypothetical protein
MAVAGGTLLLGEVRERAAAALAPLLDGDPDVLVEVVDALTPPCLMLTYDEPWLEPGADARTMGPCIFVCRLEVLAVAGRHEPGPGFAQLEELAAYTLGRLAADAYPWPLASVGAPRVFTIGGIPYLAARIIYRVRVSL